ncbi:MAG: lmo0937 family membrane protein [Novosphingobium sp.]
MMWLIVGIVLLVMWLMGALVFHVAGGLIHLLLVIAVIAVIVHFITGNRTTL